MRQGKPKPTHLKGTSAQAMREFMIAKQDEWERRDEAVGTASGSRSRLPMHSKDDTDKEKSGFFTEIARARIWRRKQSECS